MLIGNGPKIRRPISANQGVKSLTHEQRTSYSMLLNQLPLAASIHETCAVSPACSVRGRTSSVAARATRHYDVREVNRLWRLVSRSASSLGTLFVTLLLIGNAISTAAQPPQKHIPPEHILVPEGLFADIHVAVLGPNIVRIEWTPLAGANQYFVQRNGAQIGPVIQADPAATLPLSFTDNGAPANSNLTYTVVAQSISTILLADGSKHTGELPHISNAVAVVTPATSPPRWALGPDAQPSIAPNSEVLLFVHGMDSRAEEADDITNALFRALATTPHTPPPPIWPPIMATVQTATVPFTSCPNPAGGCPETCDHMDNFSNGQRAAVTPFDMLNGTATRVYFAPTVPPQMLDMTPPQGTPIPAGAQIDVPAAHNIGANEGRLSPLLRVTASAAQPLQSLQLAALKFAAGDAVWGNAYADLAVTGHKSFAIFRQAPPGEPFCQSLSGQGPGDVVNGCRTALDRAYRVANFLRTGERGDTPALKAAKTAERTALGWIAVSGEDDSPHRPVNVPASDFPQFDLLVNVETPLGPAPSVPVHTRYTIAQSQIPGRNLVVISVDLPTSGYADNLSYIVVSPLNAIGQPKSFNTDFAEVPTDATPLLDFIEAFVVHFAETLDQTVPFKNNIKAVMGGSLGGNMTFRLGRRPNVPWLPEFVVWSPASIWDSLGAGGDPLKHQGPLKAWQSADQAMKSPSPSDRAAFFGSWDKSIVPLIIPMAQSDTWTSNYYLCKMSSVAGARLDRQETYDQLFLAWHWRLGAEQLLYSHSNLDAHGQPLYLSNTKPMLLACGLEDHVPYNDICPATQKNGSADDVDTREGAVSRPDRPLARQREAQLLGATNNRIPGSLGAGRLPIHERGHGIRYAGIRLSPNG
jgi:hypothetical protein